MKHFLKTAATLVLLLTIFPLVIVFFGLFFYESAFSVKQVAAQVGMQVVAFVSVYLICCAIGWVWKED